MPSLKSDVWTSVLEEIKKSVGDRRFSLWFSNIRPMQLEGDAVTLGVPNLFVREWLETHFHDVLRTCLARQWGKTPQVRFLIHPELFQQGRARELEAGASIVEEGAARAKGAQLSDSGIRPDFTLTNFITGSANKLAYACALEIIHSGSNHLNPLFFHSRSGLGKTHLLQAIWHALSQNKDERKAEYMTAETFMNQFIYAMRNNRLDAFRHRYRRTDVLLIDDVHFLSRKSGLQEEFLHTYDALDSQNRQLVLASDVHPKMLMRIKQSLINRLASGMVIRIGQPDFSTRVAILKAKLHQQRRRLPSDVLRYVARGFEGSVRELTGAMTSVLAYASLTGEKVTVSLARKALFRLSQHPVGVSGMEGVEKVVAHYYGMKPAAWRAKKLTRTTRLARNVCMYLARQCTPMSCREIAGHFGSAHHTTAVFAVKRIQETMKKDKNLAELVSAMTEEIKRM